MALNEFYSEIPQMGQIYNKYKYLVTTTFASLTTELHFRSAVVNVIKNDI